MISLLRQLLQDPYVVDSGSLERAGQQDAFWASTATFAFNPASSRGLVFLLILLVLLIFLEQIPP